MEFNSGFKGLNLIKILPVGAELFHADGQTVRHNAANSRFRNFAKAPKNGKHLYFLPLT